jgi:selenocysteine lyase/cysteine desulfurase
MWRFIVSRLFIPRNGPSRWFSANAGYQSLGSFQSENLQYLLSIPDSEHTPPSLPFEVAPLQTTANHDDYKNDFAIDFSNWTFLNHGAFGAALNVGSQRAGQWRRFAEQQPLRYFDRNLLPHLAYTARCMAQFLDVPVQSNHVLVLPNVTAGVNAVLSGHARQHGSKQAHCILWDTTYGAVKKMAQQYYSNITEIPLQSPRYLDRLSKAASPDEVFLEALDDCLSQNPHLEQGHVSFILDHTTSNSALKMPIERLAQLVKERLSPDRCLVIVDGAHGLWMHDLHLKQYFASGVDIYMTNGHKWFSAPKGIAFMILPHDCTAVDVVQRPAIVSHGMDQPDLFSRYVWDGCRDYAAALSVPAVVQYWQQHDVATLRASCRDMLRYGVQLLAQAWQSDALIDIDSSVGSSLMTLVRLPLWLRFDDKGPQTSVHAKMVQDYLFRQNVEVPIKCINGKLYVRVSCHVYNTTDDFEKLSQCILKIPYR